MSRKRLLGKLRDSGFERSALTQEQAAAIADIFRKQVNFPVPGTDTFAKISKPDLERYLLDLESYLKAEDAKHDRRLATHLAQKEEVDV